LLFLEVHIAIVAEFYGVIHTMEEAQKMGLTNIWFECVFVLVCVAFTTRVMFRVTHIFRKENACANKLTNLRFIHRESFH